jgi:mannose-1-phosphate guanylyltransferase
MINCIILAGGAGTRLWPLSDHKYPKQFLKLFSENSLIMETSNRVKKMIPIENQYVLTGKEYARLVDENFDGEMNLIIEPMAKNTAPCILWAALIMRKKYGNDAIMVVMPSDHIIKDNEAFLAALTIAKGEAEKGEIVTFGIIPSRPEIGFGYIEIEDMIFEPNKTVKKVCAFHEKPDQLTAKKFVDSGIYMWNSGMFVFSVGTILDEFGTYAPELYANFKEIDPENREEARKAFKKSLSISIDYAIMEKTQKVCCIPSKFGWSDIGGYDSLYEEHEKDADGNVCNGNIVVEDSKNCYIHGNKRIVCLGVEDLIIVERENTILVAKRGMSQAIGNMAKKIHNNKG